MLCVSLVTGPVSWSWVTIHELEERHMTRKNPAWVFKPHLFFFKSTLHRAAVGQPNPGRPKAFIWEALRPSEACFNLRTPVSLQSRELCIRTWCFCSRKTHCSQLPS